MKPESLLAEDQRGAIEFLKRNRSGVIWGDVGKGKTPVALTALLALIRSFDVHRSLVVGTRLIADRVWNTEVTEWEHLTGLRVVRIVGTVKQRLAALAEADADIWVISRDSIRWLESLFIRVVGVDKNGTPIRQQYRKFPWDALFLDESQSYKSQSAKRTKCVFRLRQLVQRCYLLTGSLMPNGYEDLWSQCYLVDGGKRLGSKEAAYHRRFFTKEVNDGLVTYRLHKHSAEEIDRLISDIVYVLKDGRPPIEPNIIKVRLSSAEQRLYSQMAHHSVLEVGGQTITAVNAGVLWGKLLQLSNGAVYDATGAYHVVHNAKIEALLELLESLPRPVLVGYGFVHDVERIQSALASAGVGRVAVLRTNASLDEWRRGEVDIGIMHPASAGHGLNDLYVAGCRHVVWFGYSPNREFYDQLNGRIIGGHRRKDGEEYAIHHLHCENTLDDDAVSLLRFKGSQATDAQMRILRRVKEELCQHPNRAPTGSSLTAALPPSADRTRARRTNQR